ncbi:MAG: prepilin-type N-terminal cleavage/methylation domain-containing protein [Desulfohalobiaceae bacterium]|nr:prepilin-type N-terminal cleavage/methylation domain-containing protein [Desulfohalobiaceae bacterium]
MFLGILSDSYGRNFFPTKNKQYFSVEKGLSLVELLIVLGIMGILLGVGGRGLMKNLPEYRLKSATRELISNLQKTKIESAKNNKKTRIIFKTNEKKYHICTDKGSDGSWSSIADNTIISTVDLSKYKSGVGFGYGNASFDATIDGNSFPSGFDSVSYSYNGVTFNSRGTSGSGFVYLDNQKSDVYAIGTTNTGVIVFKKWNGNQWIDE